MIPEWVVEEFQTVDLGDTRRNDRLIKVIADLASQPTVSLPAAVGGGRAEVEAVYRFFENDHFDFSDSLTRPEQQVEGAGPLDEGARRGRLLHTLHAFTDSGVSLGTAGAETWTRGDQTPSVKTKVDRDKQRKQTPIEDKESQRWVDGMHLAHRIAAQVPDTQVILVSDSEADIFELLVAGHSPTTRTSRRQKRRRRCERWCE